MIPDCMCSISELFDLHVHGFTYGSSFHWIRVSASSRSCFHLLPRPPLNFHGFEAGFGMIPTCMCTISRSFVLHVFAFTYSSNPHWNSVDLEVGRHLVLIPPHRHRKARCLEVANSSFVLYWDWKPPVRSLVEPCSDTTDSSQGGTLLGSHKPATIAPII